MRFILALCGIATAIPLMATEPSGTASEQFSHSWKEKPLTRGYYSLLAKNRTYDSYDRNPPLEMNIYVVFPDGTRNRLQVMNAGPRVWAFRDRRGIMTECCSNRRVGYHDGWTRFAVAIRDGRVAVFIDGLEAHVYENVAAIEGFSVTQRPVPTRWDGFVVSDDPDALVLNPVPDLLPCEFVALKPGEPLVVPIRADPRHLVEGGRYVLELVTKQGKVIGSYVGEPKGNVRLGPVPRSGSYTLLARYERPGEFPYLNSQNVDITVVNTDWTAAAVPHERNRSRGSHRRGERHQRPLRERKAGRAHGRGYGHQYDCDMRAQLQGREGSLQDGDKRADDACRLRPHGLAWQSKLEWRRDCALRTDGMGGEGEEGCR